MPRDIDYAAIAVTNAIAEKFGRANDLKDLKVVANERTITVGRGCDVTEDTRDNLLAAIRASDTYDRLWELLADSQPADGKAQ
jgi:hypothetical protein